MITIVMDFVLPLFNDICSCLLVFIGCIRDSMWTLLRYSEINFRLPFVFAFTWLRPRGFTLKILSEAVRRLLRVRKRN